MAAVPDIPSTLEDVADAIADLERRSATIATAIGALDRDGAWGVDGAVSMAAWLRHHARMSHRAAAAWVRRGRLLTDIPEVADAATAGVWSQGHVEALGAVMRVELTSLFREHAPALIPAFAPLSVRDTEAACHAWRQRAEATMGIAPPAPRSSDLRMARASDGHLVIDGVLPPAAGAQVEHAITTALDAYRADDPRSLGERRADALASVCAYFNAHHAGDGTPRHRPHVELIFHAHELGDPHASAATSDGTALDGAATNAFLCDCVMHRVVRSGSAVLDYGRRQRLVTPALFRSVALRDGGCRFPGCDRPVRFSDAHHVVHWRNGGGTALDNLCLLCTYHHHLIHGDGWSLILGPAAEVVVTTPAGAVQTSYPRGPTSHSPVA